MWKFLKANSSRDDVLKSLQYILEGRDYVWGDFTDVPIQDPELDQIRLRVLALEKTHPRGPSDRYLNQAGEEIIRSIIQQLRGRDGSDNV